MRRPSHDEMAAATATRACPTCDAEPGASCEFAPYLRFIVLAVHAARMPEQVDACT